VASAPAAPAVTAAPAAPAPATTPAADDGARARALLEGRTAAAPPPKAGRYAVQIGAFAEDSTVREVRAKARQAGLETYTQGITVAAGRVTRVRIGPFPDREAADAAAAKARQAGLPASVLRL
jgi:DedD protein